FVEVGHEDGRRAEFGGRDAERRLVRRAPVAVVHVTGLPRVAGVGPLVLLVHAHVDGDGEVALAAPGARRPELGVAAGHDRFETSLSWIDPDHLNAAVDREVLGAGWLDGRVLDPRLEYSPRNLRYRQCWASECPYDPEGSEPQADPTNVHERSSLDRPPLRAEKRRSRRRVLRPGWPAMF